MALLLKYQIQSIIHTKLSPVKVQAKKTPQKKWPTNKTGGREMGRRRGEKILREDEMNTSYTHVA